MFAVLEGAFKNGSDAEYKLDGTGSQNLANSISARSPNIQQFYGSWSGATQTPITLTASDKDFVAYIPFVPGKDTSIGSSGAASITFNPKIDGAYDKHTKTVNLTNSCTLEPGKLYRVSVTID